MRKLTLILIIVILAVSASGCSIINGDRASYNEGIEHMEKCEYDSAIIVFDKLGDYKDSQELVKEAKYQKMIEKIEEEAIDEAIAISSDIYDYKDVDEIITGLQSDIWEDFVHSLLVDSANSEYFFSVLVNFAKNTTYEELEVYLEEQTTSLKSGTFPEAPEDISSEQVDALKEIYNSFESIISLLQSEQNSNSESEYFEFENNDIKVVAYVETVELRKLTQEFANEYVTDSDFFTEEEQVKIFATDFELSDILGFGIIIQPESYGYSISIYY